jgi:predicted dehydrogenase
VLTPIPVALIGAGRVAHAAYLPLIGRPGGQFELVAVVEPDPARVSTVVRHWAGVPVERDIEGAVRRGARAAICATPWHTHRAVVEECLRHGLPVLCEKPVSVDPGEIDRLRAAEEAAGIPVAVGYMKRHSALVGEFLERGRKAMAAAREVSVRILDPNGPDQIAHLVPAEVLRRAPAPAALAVAGRLLPGAPTAHHEALLHGLGGSLVHQVNLVHAMGLELAGHLGYATAWAGGSAVACGWRPRNDLMVRCSHVRVPGHRRYEEVIRVVADDSTITLSLPSPYARDESGQLVVTGWDGTGQEQTTIQRGALADSAFARQLVAWAAMLDGTGPALPGLAEAHRDAAVIHDAARQLT